MRHNLIHTSVSKEQLKDLRSHIIPYLKMALDFYKRLEKGEALNHHIYHSNLYDTSNFPGLCGLIRRYVESLKELSPKYRSLLEDYLDERLNFARPKEITFNVSWDYWYDQSLKGLQKRIDWIETQLKYVKP